MEASKPPLMVASLLSSGSMSPEELLEAERLHRRAVNAEALASAKVAAVERGVALKEDTTGKKPKFVPRAKREAERRAEAERLDDERLKKKTSDKQRGRFLEKPRGKEEDQPKKKRREEVKKEEKTEELSRIRDSYLGGNGEKKTRIVKPSEKFSRIFQFDWDAKDDTSYDPNPLYASRHRVQPLLGRGYVAGTDMREQRRNHTFAETLAEKRAAEERGLSRRDREAADDQRRATFKAMAEKADDVAMKTEGTKSGHWTSKKLEDMTDRDWRIFKEDFDIRVRGGRAPMPLRYWREGEMLTEPILKAIDVLGYTEPSPIQRQAIPVGLALRDVIGVAETGSGKTAAFGIPLLQYISKLPAERIANLADDGPLALVLAPTRELATQIHDEILKLGQFFPRLGCVTVVGGSSIGDQGFRLREGVEIVVGTPGRINDCLDNQYLVLNQANYVVLDEADRMIDMGFEPQVHSILEAMGGLLKSEDEIEIAEQEAAVHRGEACYRVTAMFSATMPPAVEKLAQRFLRHPAIVAIGDDESNKNKRIDQRVVYLKSDTQKRASLLELLTRKPRDDKYLVFCNEKKGCDSIYKHVSSQVRAAVIHGGKSQDQREASLLAFKSGSFSILIATDVAGRGLDIPNVAHVINFDMPLKIENYSHRIGRTARAGKSGVATTFLTPDDEPLFYDLYQYLEQTDAPIPTALEHHPAAHAKPGERNVRGELLTEKAANRAAHGKVEFLSERTFA